MTVEQLPGQITVHESICAGRTIAGEPCAVEPCATVHVGPLMACQAVEAMDDDRYVNMRVCPEHVTSFVGREAVWLCCEAVPMTLRWDGARVIDA